MAVKKDIKLPHQKPKKSWKNFIKSFKKQSKKALKNFIKYFKSQKQHGGKHAHHLILIGLVVGALALMLGLIPDLNSFGAWLAIMAMAAGLLGYLQKAGGRTRQLLLLSVVALAVCVTSVSIQNGLRQNQIDNTIDRKEGRATQELLKKDVDVTIGGYGDDGLSVTLYNRNSATKSYSIVLLAKDADGNAIIEQTITFGVLDPNETKEYKVFSTASNILKEKLKTATFEVTTVSQY
jgi:hypothetical protein